MTQSRVFGRMFVFSPGLGVGVTEPEASSGSTLGYDMSSQTAVNDGAMLCSALLFS